MYLLKLSDFANEADCRKVTVGALVSSSAPSPVFFFTTGTTVTVAVVVVFFLPSSTPPLFVLTDSTTPFRILGFVILCPPPPTTGVYDLLAALPLLLLFPMMRLFQNCFKLATPLNVSEVELLLSLSFTLSLPPLVDDDPLRGDTTEEELLLPSTVEGVLVPLLGNVVA